MKKDKLPEKSREFLAERMDLLGRYNAEIEYFYDYRCGERQDEELLVSISEGDGLEYIDLGLQIDAEKLAALVGEEWR